MYNTKETQQCQFKKPISVQHRSSESSNRMTYNTITSVMASLSTRIFISWFYHPAFRLAEGPKLLPALLPGFFQSCFSPPVQGTTVENICFELRYLNDTRGLAKDHALLLLCDLSHSNPDAVDVAIVSLKVHEPRRDNGFMFTESACCTETNSFAWNDME